MFFFVESDLTRIGSVRQEQDEQEVAVRVEHREREEFQDPQEAGGPSSSSFVFVVINMAATAPPQPEVLLNRPAGLQASSLIRAWLPSGLNY